MGNNAKAGSKENVPAPIERSHMLLEGPIIIEFPTPVAHHGADGLFLARLFAGWYVPMAALLPFRALKRE